jgi:hypothetical protein
MKKVFETTSQIDSPPPAMYGAADFFPSEFTGLRYLNGLEPNDWRRSKIAACLLGPLLQEYAKPEYYRFDELSVKLPYNLEKAPNIQIAHWLGQTVASFGVKVGIYDLSHADEVLDKSTAFVDAVTQDGAECMLVADPEDGGDHRATAAKRLISILDIPVIGVSQENLSLVAAPHLTPALTGIDPGSVRI